MNSVGGVLLALSEEAPAFSNPMTATKLEKDICTYRNICNNTMQNSINGIIRMSEIYVCLFVCVYMRVCLYPKILGKNTSLIPRLWALIFFSFILYNLFLLHWPWIMYIIRNNVNKTIIHNKSLKVNSKYLNWPIILLIVWYLKSRENQWSTLEKYTIQNKSKRKRNYKEKDPPRCPYTPLQRTLKQKIVVK